jgi:hypothetical protein
MKIRYVTLLAAIAGLMAACGNDRKVEPGPSLKEAASGKFLMGGSVECTSGSRSGYLRLESGKTSF